MYQFFDPFWTRFPWPATNRVRVDEMVPGVKRVRLVRAYRGQEIVPVFFYMVGDTAVDTGMPAARDEVVAIAREHELRRVVLTHHHEDHAGNAGPLQEAGLEVVAPPLTARLLAEDLPVPFYQHMAWGRMRPARLGTYEGRVRIGSYEAEVLPAPGHAVDQVVLYIPEKRWLFSGDVLIHERVKAFRGDEDFAASLETLERLVELEIDVLFCGHRPVAENGGAALARKLEWFRQIEEGVRRLDAEGYGYGEIIQRLGIEARGPITFFSMGDASTRNMVRSILKGPRPRRELRRILAAG